MKSNQMRLISKWLIPKHEIVAILLVYFFHVIFRERANFKNSKQFP